MQSSRTDSHFCFTSLHGGQQPKGSEKPDGYQYAFNKGTDSWIQHAAGFNATAMCIVLCKLHVGSPFCGSALMSLTLNFIRLLPSVQYGFKTPCLTY